MLLRNVQCLSNLLPLPSAYISKLNVSLQRPSTHGTSRLHLNQLLSDFPVLYATLSGFSDGGLLEPTRSHLVSSCVAEYVHITVLVLWRFDVNSPPSRAARTLG